MTSQEIKELIEYILKKENKDIDLIVKFKSLKGRWGTAHISKNTILLASDLLNQPIEKQYHTIIHETLHFTVGRVNGQWHNSTFKHKETYYLNHFGITPIRHGRAIHVSALKAANKIVWREI